MFHLDDIINQLLTKEYAIIDSLFATELTQTLYDEGASLWELGEFRTARIGKGNEEQKRTEIRSDKIHWLDPKSLTKAQQTYWDFINELRVEINRTYFFGLQDFEAHFAVYPKGSFYKKHLDQFAKTPQRYISCLLYLNHNWKAEYGGQLRIYKNGEHESDYVEVLPEFGRFVCFLSGSVYHEVMPAHRERFSLTGWLRKEYLPFDL